MEGKNLKSRILKWFLVLLLVSPPVDAWSQRMLTLDECRTMALNNNKQMQVSRVKQDIAANLRKSARTKYLPRVSALGMYEFTSREISILNNDQKSLLNNLGKVFTSAFESEMSKLPSATSNISNIHILIDKFS